MDVLRFLWVIAQLTLTLCLLLAHLISVISQVQIANRNISTTPSQAQLAAVMLGIDIFKTALLMLLTLLERLGDILRVQHPQRELMR